MENIIIFLFEDDTISHSHINIDTVDYSSAALASWLDRALISLLLPHIYNKIPHKPIAIYTTTHYYTDTGARVRWRHYDAFHFSSGGLAWDLLHFTRRGKLLTDGWGVGLYKITDSKSRLEQEDTTRQVLRAMICRVAHRLWWYTNRRHHDLISNDAYARRHDNESFLIAEMQRMKYDKWQRSQENILIWN